MEYVDVVNQALQLIGTRTTVTQTELDNETSNEAKQANLILVTYRDNLLRMAPWNCARNYANLALITAQPGTPENTSPASPLWEPGLPAPPWVYEYQYPVSCLRPIQVVPAFQPGMLNGVPIFPVATGGAAAFWQGPPVKYQVSTDRFYAATSAAIVSGGTGYEALDEIILEGGATDEPPIGAPARLQVLTVGPGGVITTVSVTNEVAGSLNPIGGSYFNKQTGTIAQGSTNGSGTGATFSLTFATQKSDQRVILTNQQDAILCFVRRVDDPNVWDTLFQSAYVSLVASGLAFTLSGDKALANALVENANNDIAEARKADGNEGLTINDVTPDWIRARGYDGPDGSQWSGNSGFNWGPLWAAW